MSSPPAAASGLQPSAAWPSRRPKWRLSAWVVDYFDCRSTAHSPWTSSLSPFSRNSARKSQTSCRRTGSPDPPHSLACYLNFCPGLRLLSVNMAMARAVHLRTRLTQTFKRPVQPACTSQCRMRLPGRWTCRHLRKCLHGPRKHVISSQPQSPKTRAGRSVWPQAERFIPAQLMFDARTDNDSRTSDGQSNLFPTQTGSAAGKPWPRNNEEDQSSVNLTQAPPGLFGHDRCP